MPPRPGDRSPGFFIEPTRCWAFVYDHNLQGTHCRETPAFTGRWLSPRGDGTGGECGAARAMSRG
jgi:hypothetical protein